MLIGMLVGIFTIAALWVVYIATKKDSGFKSRCWECQQHFKKSAKDMSLYCKACCNKG